MDSCKEDLIDFKAAREVNAIQMALFVGHSEKGISCIIQKICLNSLIRPFKSQLINAPNSALLQQKPMAVLHTKYLRGKYMSTLF